MNPFRGYLKIKTKEGKNELFQSLIPSFIEIVKDTEPKTLQFEAFANQARREIIWLESYSDNTGLDTHLANPALEDLKFKMMPLQEAVIDMYLMSSPTESTLAGFQQYGIHPIIPTPWPGTIRLNEARNESTNLQTFVVMDLNDLEAYREISEQVEAAAARQPGVLFHRSYQVDENQVIVFEEYNDSDSLMSWAEVFAQNAGNFGSLVTGMTYEVCGQPSASCKKMLNGWGAVYFEKIAGFKRFV